MLSTGLLHGLHQLWPDAGITMLVRPPHGGVAAILPDWLNVPALPFDPRVSLVGREEQVASHLRAAGVNTASSSSANTAS